MPTIPSMRLRLVSILLLPIKVPRRAAIVLLALAVGLAAVLPYYAAEYALGNAYRGMPALVTDAEGEYLTENQEIVEGHWNIGSPYFHEYKDSPMVVPPTANWLYAAPSIALGISPVAVDMLYKFLLPALLFVLLFLLLEEITASSFWSATGALLIASGMQFAYNLFLAHIFVGGFPDGYLSAWTRPVNPVTGMLGLAAYFWLVYRVFAGRSRNIVVPGAIIGVMIGYFFSFAYAGVFSVVLIAASLLLRQRAIALRLVAILGIGALVTLVLAAPLVISLISGHAASSVDPQLQGLFFTHLPFYNKTSLAATLLFLAASGVVYARYRRALWREPWWVFSGALLIANQGVYNIQVLSGWTVWPAHFSGYTNVTVLIVLFLAGAEFARAYRRAGRVLGWAAIALLVLALARTLPSYEAYLPSLVKFESYQPTMAWIRAHSGSACVVFTGQDHATALAFNRFVTAYTRCDVYETLDVFRGVPRDRVMDSVLASLWLQGVSPGDLPQYFADHEFEMRGYFFRDWAELFVGQDAWVNRFETPAEWQERYKELQTDITARYRAFLAGDIRAELGKYRLDYIVTDGTSRVRTDLDRYSWLTPVFSDGAYRVYAFKS